MYKTDLLYNSFPHMKDQDDEQFFVWISECTFESFFRNLITSTNFSTKPKENESS